LNDVKEYIATKTLTFRHSIVKLIAPTFYRNQIRASYFPRPMINFLRQGLGLKSLIGVEIGVAFGENAESIMETLNMEKLFLVDAYQRFFVNDSLYSYYVGARKFAIERLAKFGDRVIFIRKFSMHALEEIPNELDFVYIDGNHAYSFVKEDIEGYYEKVKEGGVIGGHDFNRMHKGVLQAVVEFTQDNDIEFYNQINDWWLLKHE